MTIISINMGGYKIRSRKNPHVIKSNGLFKLIVMKSSVHVKALSKVHLHF